jgi:hypothetical protein
MHSIQVPLEVSKGEFISRLEFTIILMILLYSIISKVYEFIIEVLHIELFGSSADVPILEPIALLVPIHTCYADIHSNIELSLLVQKRHYVLLNYMRTRPTLLVRLLPFHYLSYLFYRLHHFNTRTPVSVLSRLHQPGISLLRLKTIFKLLTLLLLLLLLYRLCPPLVLL